MKFIKPLSDFINESVNEAVSYQNIAKELVEIAAYYTDADLSSEMTNANKCDDANKVTEFFSSLKDMMKDEEPGKIKEFEIEASRFLAKNKISESTNEGDSNLKNYMFFGNLKTIKNRVEEILLMDPSVVDGILQDGHNWAVDHVTTSKDDVEEVSNFLKNEVKETGSGKVPESATNEAMVQVSGKSKPAGAKILAMVIVDELEKNGMLKPGVNTNNVKNDVMELIMSSTF
jgi:hypothetical protein